MLNKLFQCKGWTVAEINIHDFCVDVKLVIDQRCTFTCPHCGGKLVTHSLREIKAQDLPMVGQPVALWVQTLQGCCAACGKFSTHRPTLLHPTMGYTLRYMKEVSDIYLYMPSSVVADKMCTSVSSVQRIDKDVLKRELPEPCLDHVEGMLADEKYFGKKGFATLVLNARTSEPLHLAPGKDEAALDSFFERLSDEQLDSIKCIGIDRGNAYRASALSNKPDIAICYDPFHLVSNMLDVVDKVRRQEMAIAKKEKDAEKQEYLAGTRYLLLNNPENLKEDGAQRLKQLMEVNQNLHTVYTLKEQFRAIFQDKEGDAPMWSLVEWIRMAAASGIEAVVKFAKGIAARANDIWNAFRFKMNSGRIESANAALERIVRKACGLFDFPYILLKLRQQFFIHQQQQERKNRHPRRVLSAQQI